MQRLSTSTMFYVLCCSQYSWVDERGKKSKCAAPQYVDYVLCCSQYSWVDERGKKSKCAAPQYVTLCSMLQPVQLGG